MSESILALHGMTMCGSSMRQAMGPLLGSLQERGFDVIAPNGGHRMSDDDLSDFLEWMKPVYLRRGHDVHEQFRRGAFWEGHENFDWLRSESPPVGDQFKRYHALSKSLEVIREATEGKSVVGVFAFSQGAVFATVLAYLTARNEAPLPPPQWAVYIAGFPPRVEKPLRVTYPIPAHYRRLFVIGKRDPVFPTGKQHLEQWAACFEGGSNDFLEAPCGHDVPRDAESVERMLAFIDEKAARGPH